MLLADVFITTKGRFNQFELSLASFFKNTDPNTYRLTIVDDTGVQRKPELFQSLTVPDEHHIDHVLIHGKNAGLGPSINQALAHIDALNRWYEHPLAADPAQVAPFICYCQDDLLYTSGWLERLAKMFILMEYRPDPQSKNLELGFASGIECVEHKTRKDLGNGLLLKDWIRAANMFGRRDYWMSMFPIPRFDPETQRIRAKPNNGMGSGVDWHFIRNHNNSVCQTMRTCLVIPGLLQHMGYSSSTWLDRELPESEADKRAVEEFLS